MVDASIWEVEGEIVKGELVGMSDGAAFLQLHNEIKECWEDIARLRSEAYGYRSLAETWMRESIGGEKMLKLRMHEAFPNILPFYLEQALKDVEEVR